MPLPSPSELRLRTLDALDEAKELWEPDRSAVVDLVEARAFEYEVVPGKDAASWLLEVVIHTDPSHARLLADHANPVVQAFYGALGTVCPDLGTDRVVAHE